MHDVACILRQALQGGRSNGARVVAALAAALNKQPDPSLGKPRAFVLFSYPLHRKEDTTADMELVQNLKELTEPTLFIRGRGVHSSTVWLNVTFTHVMCWGNAGWRCGR